MIHKRFRLSWKNCAAQLLLLAALSGSSSTSFLVQAQSDAVLTNAAVVRLVKAGFKEKTIIAIINSRPNRFSLDTDQLIQLKKSGVSERVIMAMLAFRGLVAVNDDEAWADDQFFRGSSMEPTQSDPNASPGTSADIFGSGSNSRSSSRSRGVRGGNENEGNLTGSATVRIIRPPAEAGSVPMKLEKVKTLDNDGVIAMIDAGFSEGTIIKRIEDSPVDFDLSPGKVAELHKRRVTDAIIAAMTAAMGDAPTKQTSRQPERDN
ncbi:MAG TPA: hypothetical protein VGP85_05765 [Pyrinomonadaceae bacterium]|jgi:hypothetical protein|nr:hypothetical protein [Pyrinomonadaceae bacterium]